jgi:hypothetical protein
VNWGGSFLLGLACAACGGQIDRVGGAPEDAAPPTEAAATPPPRIAVGDAGMTCSVPVVSPGDSASDVCNFTMSCTGGLTVSGYSFGPGGGQGSIVRCSVNGQQTDNFTALDVPSCADPTGFATLAADCRQ